jgi:hypothetical protein
MSEGTKQQIREFLEQAVKKAQNPDLREQLKRAREKKRKVVAGRYGL